MCAVCGLTPSASSITSAFPWSAVTKHTPPAARTQSRTRPSIAIGLLDGCDDRGDRARMADHVRVREVDDAERVAVADLVAHAPARPRRRHLGLQVVARDVARRRDEDPRLALPLALLAAVEEVRHVRVLLGLRDVELPQRRAPRAPRRACSARPARRTRPGRGSRRGSASSSSGRPPPRGGAARAGALGRAGS